MAMPRLSLLVLLALLAAVRGVGQSTTQSGGARIEILNADRWEHDERIAHGAQRLLGDVRFKHADATMHCDSAYLFEDQTMQAFDHVGIDQGDSLHITGDRLDYDGRQRLATITGNVHLNDPGMELTTDALTYSVRDHVARYTTGATIVSKRPGSEGNTLTSRHGSYLAEAHRFLFSDHVHLQGSERTIDSDTLHYATLTGIADLLGPTHIVQGTTDMWCERGAYNTRTDQGRFTKAGRVVDHGQELRGDSLHYNGKSGQGQAWGHVMVVDTANDLLVQGDLGTHDQRTGRSMITGRAELIMRMSDDSLFLHADTLFAHSDSSGKYILARRGVRFYKDDMQGVCDTMTYAESDSLITLLGSPFLWSREDQIMGRIITITLRDGRAHRLHVLHDALLANEVDSTRYDQVTGTTITGFFEHDELVRITAEGNTRTVYFATEKDSLAAPRVTAMNRADCSFIQVGLDSGKVRTISFVTKPDATMYPINKAPEDQLRMKGFVWNEAERPTDRPDIFRRFRTEDQVDR